MFLIRLTLFYVFPQPLALDQLKGVNHIEPFLGRTSDALPTNCSDILLDSCDPLAEHLLLVTLANQLI